MKELDALAPATAGPLEQAAQAIAYIFEQGASGGIEVRGVQLPLGDVARHAGHGGGHG